MRLERRRSGATGWVSDPGSVSTVAAGERIGSSTGKGVSDKEEGLVVSVVGEPGWQEERFSSSGGESK